MIINDYMVELPEGWHDIGLQMFEELESVLGKYVDDFIILQLKEKFNKIRLYWHWHWVDREYTEEENAEMTVIHHKIGNILKKYAELSYNTCTICGKPATKWTNGWVASYCDSCYERMNHRG